jgi:hypothetical protein
VEDGAARAAPLLREAARRERAALRYTCAIYAAAKLTVAYSPNSPAIWIHWLKIWESGLRYHIPVSD